jgi:hypothetical protein
MTQDYTSSADAGKHNTATSSCSAPWTSVIFIILSFGFQRNLYD